jgi:hypothetical protein
MPQDWAAAARAVLTPRPPHRRRRVHPCRRLCRQVILCPGLGSSGAYCFDLSPAVSLADFLAERGWDVWTVELRGGWVGGGWGVGGWVGGGWMGGGWAGGDGWAGGWGWVGRGPRGACREASMRIMELRGGIRACTGYIYRVYICILYISIVHMCTIKAAKQGSTSPTARGEAPAWLYPCVTPPPPAPRPPPPPRQRAKRQALPACGPRQLVDHRHACGEGKGGRDAGFGAGMGMGAGPPRRRPHLP